MKKRWMIIVAAIFIMGLAGLNVLAYAHAYALTHFTVAGPLTDKPEVLRGMQKLKVLLTGVNIPRPISGKSPSDLAADCEALTINGQDGIRLELWYCNRGETTPLAVLFHGYAAEKTALLAEAKAILELGGSVLLVDFRGSGGSSESYTTIGVREADDVAAAVRYAKENTTHLRIVLYGQSMGTAAVLRSIKYCDVRPDAIIIEAVFDTMLNTIRNRFHTMRVLSFPGAELLTFWGGRQFGFDGFEHNPVEYAASVRCPALFLHGENDPRARMEEGQHVYESVPGEKRIVIF